MINTIKYHIKQYFDNRRENKEIEQLKTTDDIILEKYKEHIVTERPKGKPYYHDWLGNFNPDKDILRILKGLEVLGAPFKLSVKDDPYRSGLKWINLFVESEAYSTLDKEIQEIHPDRFIVDREHELRRITGKYGLGEHGLAEKPDEKLEQICEFFDIKKPRSWKYLTNKVPLFNKVNS